MKLKKLLLQLGLLLTVTFLGLTGIRMAEAAATIPAGSSVVSMDGNVYIPNKTTWTTVPNIEDGYTSLGYYPSILDIRANNLSATGRVTTKTTKIWVLYGSYMTEKNGGTFGNVYADIMTDGGGTVTTNSPVNMMSSASKKFTPPNTYQEMTVDLSDLAHDLPLYVGLRYTMQNSYDDPRPYFGGQITADKLAATTLKDVLITPTSGTDTNGVSNLSSSDTSISGTAEPSSTVSVTLNGKVYSTTASSGSDGAYTIPLGASLKSLGATDSVKVTESNDEGDSKSSTANVTSTVPLTITSATPSLTISPDDWDAHIAGKSSSDIATWIASQTGMTATKPDGTTPSTLAFDTTDGDSLKATVAGGTQDVTMNASDSDGNASTTPATISVTRGAGKLQFGDMTDMVFGNGATLPVPGQQTLYAPGDYQINISDTREMGSAWYVTASATPMTSTDGSNRALSGHIVYEDGNGTKSQLDSGNEVSVASGQRDSNSTDIAKSWNQDGKSYNGSSVPAGVYLDANPNIYAAGGATGYAGVITWSLTDAPAN